MSEKSPRETKLCENCGGPVTGLRCSTCGKSTLSEDQVFTPPSVDPKTRERIDDEASEGPSCPNCGQVGVEDQADCPICGEGAQ